MSAPLFKPGDQVVSRVEPGRTGVIKALGPLHAGIQYYDVFWGSAQGSTQVAEQDLLPHVAQMLPSQSLAAGRISGYADFQRLITFHRLRRDRPLRNNIYAFNASRTKFFSYQFRPLMKFLDSPVGRLLVCDEVGLGKTIEAGLILTELRARGELRTVLVVCPASLVDKWRLELRRRFGEEFRHLRAQDMLGLLDDFEEQAQRPELNGIVSYETLRGQRILQRLEEVAPPLDLVIADEAHHMRNMGTLTRRAGAALSAHSDALILLTATPVHLGNENLFSLLNLLDEEDFPDAALAQQRFRENEPIVAAQRQMSRLDPDIEAVLLLLRDAAGSPWLVGSPLLPRLLRELEALATGPKPEQARRKARYLIQRDLADLNLLGHLFTRTRRKDVHVSVPLRKAAAVEVTFSGHERDFYEAVTRYVRQLGHEKDDLPVVTQWRLNGFQRRAASSIPALVKYFRRTGGLMAADSVIEDDDFGWEDTGIVELSEDARSRLKGIVANWDDGWSDSKYERLREILQSPEVGGAKLIVFAFFRDTLDYLYRRLTADGIECKLLHGGFSPEERTEIMAQFKDQRNVKVLLSSRVGSEGLDFQFCSTVVNYDLPWNPMEVEQRIGRVDRIGQEAKVIHIFNFWTIDTIEERILRRLYDRIGVFERSIGSLDAIVGDVVRDLEQLVLSKELTPEQEEAEAKRMEAVLDAQLHQTEAIESEAARFLGMDEFFNEEVAAIQSNRRYVTSAQLRRFVEHFIHETAPGTRLKYNSHEGRGALTPDSALGRFIKSQGIVDEALAFVASGQQPIPITFDRDVAFENPGIEFLNVLHPLVRAIVKSYERGETLAAAAHHVALQTDRLPPGCYVFSVYRLTVNAGRPQTTLEAVVLREDLSEAASSDDAEALLGEMVERGDEPHGGAMTLDPEFARVAISAAERLFLERQQAIRARLEEDNEAFIERRLASVRTSYHRKLERIGKRLRDGRERGRQDRYLRMLKGQESRTEAELLAKERELNALRGVQLEHTEVAAGILEILGPLPAA